MLKWSTKAPKSTEGEKSPTVRFFENQISRSLCPYMVFREANGLFEWYYVKNSRLLIFFMVFESK
jgi:hypothetical protein